VEWSFLGRVRYADAVHLQEQVRAAVRRGDGPERLLLLEHPPVYTLGRNAEPSDVTADAGWLERMGIEVHESDRGGQVTYHGPGQLVGYPILDLDRRGRDIHRYLRTLEAMLIDVAGRFGIGAGRREGRTGVWVRNDKLAAIGIGVRRWVTMHGFAINVDDLRPAFRAIVPCGLADSGVTSIREAGGRPVAREVVEAAVCEAFCAHFGYDAVVEPDA